MNRFLCASILVLAGLQLTGCTSASDLGTTTTDATSAPNYEKQIADIQNNPNIPDDKKQIAIAQIRGNMSRAASQGKAIDASK